MDGSRFLALIAMFAVIMVIGMVWWWLTIGMSINRKDEKARRRLRLGIEVNLVLVALAYVLSPSEILYGLLAPWYPPVVALFVVPQYYSAMLPFMTLPLAIGAGAAAMGLVLALLVKPLRPYGILIVGLAFIGATLVSAELRAPGVILAKAKERGASCLAQRGFSEARHAIAQSPRLQLHALARIDGAWMGWSYSLQDFYEIPADVVFEAPTKEDCVPLAE